MRSKEDRKKIEKYKSIRMPLIRMKREEQMEGRGTASFLKSSFSVFLPHDFKMILNG